MGLIPRSAKWVTDPVLQQLWYIIGCNSGSDSIPGLGTPYAAEQPKKREKKVDDYKLNQMVPLITTTVLDRILS